MHHQQTADGTRPVTPNEISVDSFESVWNKRWAGMQRPSTCTTRLAGCLKQSRLRRCPCRSQGGAISWEQRVKDKVYVSEGQSYLLASNQCSVRACLLRMRAGVKAHVSGCGRTPSRRRDSCCRDVWRWALRLLGTRDKLACRGLAGLGYWVLLEYYRETGVGPLRRIGSVGARARVCKEW